MKFSVAQIKLLQELTEPHHEGPSGYWYFPYTKKRTGDILVKYRMAECDIGPGLFRIGYRITQKGRDLLEAWETR